MITVIAAKQCVFVALPPIVTCRAGADALSVSAILLYLMEADRYSRRPNLRNYTYLDDMKLYVIGVLAEKGLKFDETKTSNTFAYYTSVIKMAFNRVLGFESKHQNIRDALLNEAGMNGSFKSQAREAE